ncbi:MAG: glycosyltransferase, partial [Anaerolineae bacterium]
MIPGRPLDNRGGAGGSSSRARPLRVCLVSGEYPPDEGGVADYTALLAAELARAGHAVEVLTSGRGRGAAAAATAKGGPLVLRSMPRWDLWTPRRVASCVGRTRPDVVHLQYQTAAFDLSPWVAAVPWWLGRRRGAITAVTYHDLLVPYLFPKAGPLRQWVTWVPARHADLTVATNV